MTSVEDGRTHNGDPRVSFARGRGGDCPLDGRGVFSSWVQDISVVIGDEGVSRRGKREALVTRREQRVLMAGVSSKNPKQSLIVL